MFWGFPISPSASATSPTLALHPVLPVLHSSLEMMMLWWSHNGCPQVEAHATHPTLTLLCWTKHLGIMYVSVGGGHHVWLPSWPLSVFHALSSRMVSMGIYHHSGSTSPTGLSSHPRPLSSAKSLFLVLIWILALIIFCSKGHFP